MKLLFALGHNDKARGVLDDLRPPHLLSSFAYPDAWHRLAYHPRTLYIDSGAFSAWNAGHEIDVAAYADYCDRVDTDAPDGTETAFVNLDVIPGAPGQTSTEAEREASMRESRENAAVLRERGVRVMEVYHQDEPASYLTELLDAMPGGGAREAGGILGISPRNDTSVKRRVTWLRWVLARLLERYDPADLPRMHGLAATGIDFLRAFPFYSVDSSTYLVGPKYGHYIDTDGRQREIDNHHGLPSSRPPEAQIYAMRLSVRNLRAMERRVTRLWAGRGITFDTNPQPIPLDA